MTYPLGYPLASSRSSQTTGNGGSSHAASARKDSRSSLSSSRRLSPRRLAEIEGRLSERDLQIMALVGRFRVLSGAQLQRLFWPEGSSQTRARLTRHGLARLSRLGVLAPLARTVGGVRAGSAGRCYALGLAGQRLLGTGTRQPRNPYTPGERYLAHALAVSELYVELVQAQRRGVAEIIAFDPEPVCWRPYTGPWASRLVLKPDAYLKLGVGEYAHSWLIERDMATESLATIERKAQRHLDYYRSGQEQRTKRVAARVAWIAPDEQRARAIGAALERLPAEAAQLFAVGTAAEALSLLTGGAPS